jgi:hypothetical protein
MIWVPEDPNTWVQDTNTGSVAEVTVNDRQRILSTRLLRVAAAFALSADKRADRRQDCAVFALACESGSLFTEITFNKPGGSKVVADITPIEGLSFDNADEAVGSYMRVGGIVVTSSLRDPAKFASSKTHYLVKASVDNEQALYLSKFGATGPVGLSTLDASMDLYPTRMIGIASNFRMAEIPQP